MWICFRQRCASIDALDDGAGSGPRLGEPELGEVSEPDARITAAGSVAVLPRAALGSDAKRQAGDRSVKIFARRQGRDGGGG